MRISRATATGIYINTVGIKNNLNQIKLIIPYKIISVLKSNAYGLGIENILPTVMNSVYKVAINDIEEYFNHKLYNFPINFILLFPELDENLITDVLRYPNVEICINSREMLEILSKIKDIKIKAHLEVDTGMNRTGIRYDSRVILADNIELVGIYTHLKNDTIQDNTEQIIKFYEFIESNRIALTRLDISILSTTGVLNYPSFLKVDDYRVNFILKVSNTARVGILQYGIVPSVKYLRLKEELNLRSCIKMEVGFLGSKIVKKGETIGYTSKYLNLAHKDLLIGLAYLGYSKIPFCNNLYFDVVTDRRRFIAKSVGTMSMDIVAFDLSDLNDGENIKKIYLLSENIDLEVQAELNNHLVYNFLTCMGSIKKYLYGGDNYPEV